MDCYLHTTDIAEAEPVLIPGTDERPDFITIRVRNRYMVEIVGVYVTPYGVDGAKRLRDALNDAIASMERVTAPGPAVEVAS